MTGRADALIEIAAVSKDYRGLRPLRIEQFTIVEGESTAILDFDGPMAETFVNLVTGAAMPDRGEIRIFGRPTASIEDSADWLRLVDRFGIVSERAVLLDSLSVVQNLSMPFTLEIEPPPADVAARAEHLAAEAGLPPSDWARRVSELDPGGRLRTRLARALALDPKVLLLEHASAGVPSERVSEIGAHIRRVTEKRECALVALTGDRRFAAAVAARVLGFEPSTGRLSPHRGLPRWFLRR